MALHIKQEIKWLRGLSKVFFVLRVYLKTDDEVGLFLFRINLGYRFMRLLQR